MFRKPLSCNAPFKTSRGDRLSYTTGYLVLNHTYQDSALLKEQRICVCDLSYSEYPKRGYVTIIPIDKRDDASTQQIWRGDVSSDTANMKTVAASTVIPPWLTGGDWTFMTHSIASVCRAVVCLMFDPVGWDQFGLVSRPSPSPLAIYTEVTENTPQSSWAGLSCTKSYLVGVCTGVSGEAKTIKQL